MYDLIVIGGGPAGVTAALRARELGANVAIIERGLLGGTCTNDGCVPTRALAKAARLMRDSEQFATYGLDAPRPTLDFTRLMARTQQVVYQVQEKKQLIAHLQELNVDVFHNVGFARFVDPHTLALENGQTLSADKFIIAVGGHARKLDLPGAEHALTHSDVWRMTKLPASAIIVGGGATGCQLASIFDTFGCKVTLIDIAPRILITEDQHITDEMIDQFSRTGIEIITGINAVNRIDKRPDRFLDVTFTYADQPQTRTVEAVLLSVGWPGNLDALNLSAANVATKGAYIQVDDQLRTTAPHIFAVGDINGRMMLVQSASHQARIAAENAILGANRVDEMALVPHGGFTDPEYGSVGLTEEQARGQYPVAVAMVPYADMDRAVIDGRPVGFCKLIVHRETRLILGAHVVGEQAVEVIQIIAAAVAGDMRIEGLAELEFAYPTFAAIIGVAARQIARELNVVPTDKSSLPRWSELAKIRLAEWERRE